MLRFYRSTEGIVITLVAYVVLAFGVVALHTMFAESPLLAVASIALGGAGFYLWADAVGRVADALHERTEGFLAAVFSA